MFATLFVIGIIVGPFIAAFCALTAAEKGNYARATACHIAYIAVSLTWCLLPPLGLKLGILLPSETDSAAFKSWVIITAAAAAILIIELYCYRHHYHNFFSFSFSYISIIVLQYGALMLFTLNDNMFLTQP